MDLKKLELSYVVPFYQDNKDNFCLEKLLNTYSKYDKNLLDKIHFIFVDDCSPIPLEINNKELNYTVVRILDNITWNQGGARNLGVSLAKTPKLILTDLDHLFSEKTFKYLCSKNIKYLSNKIYKFRRKRDGKKVNSPPNILFCTKSTFYKSLGVDEEFCGNYGHEDIYFVALQKYLGTRIKKFRKHYISTTKNHNQHNLKRDTEINAKLLEEKLAAIKKNDPFIAHSRESISFKWEFVDANWL